MADCAKKRKLSTTPPPSASTSESPTDIDFSKCCICYDIYNRTNRAPISVGCGHTFCQKCVRRITKIKSQKKTFACPVCRSISILDIGNFTKNLAFIQALEKLNLLASDDTEEPDLPDIAQPNAPTGESDEDYSSSDSDASEDDAGVASGSNQNSGSNGDASFGNARGVPRLMGPPVRLRPRLPIGFSIANLQVRATNNLDSSQRAVSSLSIFNPPVAGEVEQQRNDAPVGSSNDQNQD